MKFMITGNPIDGFRLIGPFDTDADVQDYADTIGTPAWQEDWWIMKPTPPKGSEPRLPMDARKGHNDIDSKI
tara:strand:+ start:90 stop:305 length:216 start_codon:yes stop_codon:yes gene_type:complete